MECPSCQFHNMPSSNGCVRCGTRLDLSGVNYLPPRASGSMAIRAARVRFDKLAMATGDVFNFLMKPIRARRIELRHTTATDLLASVIPGLGQMRTGQRKVGRAIFTIWAGALALTCLSVGTSWFWLFATIVIGSHCTAINLLLMEDLRGHTLLQRIFVGLGVYLTLMLLVYMPVWWTASQMGTIYVMPPGVHSTTVRPGDSLLLTSNWTMRPYARGDLVRARFDFLMHGAVVYQRLETVDRIVAMPGDSLIIRNGVLFVNGTLAPPEMLPLEPLPGSFTFNVVCPPDHAIIFPSAVQWQATLGVPQGGYRSLYLSNRYLVPLSDIEGQVVMRLRPLRRAGAVVPEQRRVPESTSSSDISGDMPSDTAQDHTPTPVLAISG
jgi:hypothetical protein